MQTEHSCRIIEIETSGLDPARERRSTRTCVLSPCMHRAGHPSVRSCLGVEGVGFGLDLRARLRLSGDVISLCVFPRSAIHGHAQAEKIFKLSYFIKRDIPG
eukprot:983755-Amorphochlora_amoeboformis.AAC.1